MQRVAQRLREIIGPEDSDLYGERLIFAICVDEIECWLLPLWAPLERVGNTSNCFNTLNTALRRKNQSAIPERKKVPQYEAASWGYRKRADLLAEGPKNPSLAVFLQELEKRSITLSED